MINPQTRNFRRCRRYAGRAAAVLALMLAGSPIEARQQGSVSVPTSVLERYTGEYDQDGTTVKIVLDGGTLFREVPGQRVPLAPISENLFRVGTSPFTAEFSIDQAGGITLIVASAATEFRLPRKGARAAAPPPPPPAVHVPRTVLEQYVGVYEYLPGQMNRTDLTITVRLRGDTLSRQMGAQEAILTPISETRFRVANTSLVVEFVVDDAGVTQVLGFGFQQVLARLRPKR